MNKQELRDIIRKNNNELDILYKIEASKVITEKVLSSERYNKAERVFCYVSMKNEPGTDCIISKALTDGKTVCVPKCIDKHNMIPVKISSLNCLKEGYYGIREPDLPENNEEIPEFDLAIIPCMSSSADGKRLGHGAGYYDRFLATSTAFKMCLCFKTLLSDEIPTDEYDIIMDEIVTD